MQTNQALNSKDTELEHWRYLLQTAEQARNDIRNSLVESAENIKAIREREKAVYTKILEENGKLKEENAVLSET